MVEVCGTVAGSYFRNQPQLVHRFFFVCNDIKTFGISQVMQVHVEDGGGQQFGSHETLVECFLVQYLFNQAVGNDFAGLVMLGIHFQHFGFGSPMLVDLRGEFHEVAYDIGA